MRTKAIAPLLTALLLGALLPTPAQAAFGLKDLDVTFTDASGTASMQAGSHPFAFQTDLAVNTRLDPETSLEVPEEEVEDLRIDFPPGLVLHPTAVPRCDSADFLDFVATGEPNCPDASALGVTKISYANASADLYELPVYNLEPAPGTAFKAGFVVTSVPVTITGAVRPDPPYNAFATSSNITQASYFFSSETTIWGNPASPVHDPDRGHCAGEPDTDSCPANIPEVALVTLPRSCQGPLATTFWVRSWQGSEFEDTIETHDDSDPPGPLGMTGCGKLGFAPKIASEPTTDHAESPSGLDFHLEISDEGLLNPDGIANSDIKEAVIALPEGVTANPSLAEGLATCSPTDYGEEALGIPADQGCPEASKIGTVEVETPLLEGTLLKGQVFIASQDDPKTTVKGAENPFDSLLAFYMVIEEPKLGILVKVPAKVEPEPGTGRLLTTVSDIPQFPFSDFRFHFREGGRSPLITPPTCGTYTTEATFTPWANPETELRTTAEFEITRGVGGSECPPAGTPPFQPDFEAGTLNNHAGSFSPFFMRLTRRDGDQDMTRFSATLPPGVVGKLAGISKCSEQRIARAKRRSGRDELASPSCPRSSEVGDTLAGAGVGSQLTYVRGKLYLAGPFAGAPLSVVAITPAVAGPFDVGTVVVREALDLNSRTAQVIADGSRSDPIPHILEGIPLKLRDLRVFVDRENFILNPTDCSRFETRATLFGGGTLLAPTDDAPISLKDRFRAANCAALGFKPRLKLRLKGGTRRGDNPALRAVLRPRPGDANLEDAVARLPRSAFLDQDHIGTICTRVQFAAESCPKGAIYGRVTAFTPLLEEPLRGPIYLRSSDNDLPDVVFDLKGLVDVEASARIDSIRGGIRFTFTDLPDAPLSKVVVKAAGGDKGLIVNSRNLCAGRPARARILLGAQNNDSLGLRPRLRASCAKRKR